MSNDDAPDYKAARAFCDNLAAGAGLAWQPPELANLMRAFIALDEKRQNTPPAQLPIERISLSLEHYAEGWMFAQARALHNGQRFGCKLRENMRDIERGSIDLPAFALRQSLVKVARECPGNWAVDQFMAFIAKGQL